MTEEENNFHNRKPSRKSSVPVYFVLMLFGCLFIGGVGAAAGLNPFVSFGIPLFGSIYWCYKLEMKHWEKYPRQAWEKAQAKRTAVVTTLILGITAILMIAGKVEFAFGFLGLSVLACMLYLGAYELVQPHAKDRKSAIQLAITVIVVIVVVVYVSKQSQRPAIKNRPNPGINR